MVVKKCLAILTVGIIFCLSSEAYSESQAIAVSQPSDDAEESANGSVSLTSSDLELVEDNSLQTVGMRFRGVNIPQGARVTIAYIQLTCDETRSVNPCELVIRGQADDDAATFATSPRNISSRNRTAAAVNWAPPNWNRAGDAGPDQTTPDLSGVIQEIVSRDGWVQGNSLAIIIGGVGTRVAQAYGGSAAVLHLVWSMHDCAVGFGKAEASGPEDGRTINIDVSLSPAVSGATVTVDYIVTDITTDSSDYTPHPASGRLSFPPGTTLQAIRITPRADTDPEGDEQFRVILSNPRGGSLDVALGSITEHIYTIIDSSPKVMFLEPSSSGDEDGGLVSLGVWLSDFSTQAVTVDYTVQTEGTTAQSLSDYTLLGTGTLTFPPGSFWQSIDLMILDDLIPERSEQIVLVLSNPKNASLGSPSEHVYTINASELPRDWPMWRCDANRSGASSFLLSLPLYLQWELRLPRLEQAWPDQGSRMDYDRCYQPIVLGKALFVGSSVTDSVTAYDTETGLVKWRFFADAPVRFAPAGWTDNPASPADDRVFVVSDDGGLYCLNANDGSVVWKFLGAPSGKKGIGNKRLGSLWPARGGPTVLDDTVYFSAGIWPFMGVFIYALDAATGDCLWLNDGSGSIYMTQPHNADSFAALAPQGYLVAVGDRLIVPNSRANAAGLDRYTGELLYCDLNSNNSKSTNHVAAYGDHFNNSGRLFNIADGSSAGSLEDGAVMSAAGNYTQTFCMAGDLLYKGAKGSVWATTSEGNQLWQATITGRPASMLAAEGRLFIVTEEGSIYCYGSKSVSSPPVFIEAMERLGWPPQDEWTTAAEDILATTGISEGYCLVLGVGTGRLMEELARAAKANSYDLHVIGLDPDPAKIEMLRNRWHGMGILNEQLSAVVGDIRTAEFPPYLAHLIVSEDLEAAGIDNASTFVEKAFHSLRPYGGKICFGVETLGLLQDAAAGGTLGNADVRASGDYAMLERVGALPGSADWTHLYADASNTVVSKDTLVKAPLGLLWFGGSTNLKVLPRHIHGPSEQVVGGRLFIEGAHYMTARDVYTGRVIWERNLPDLGTYYKGALDADPAHYSGANVVGTNYVCADDGVYIARGAECLRLDPATGNTMQTFSLTQGAAAGADFVQLRIWNNLLIVGADPVIYPGDVGDMNWNETSCRDLVVMDRYNGQVKWQRRAEHSFHHNTIIVGKCSRRDTLFCIDRVPPSQADALSRRGIQANNPNAPWRLMALDVATGNEIWSTTGDVFGTWLGYSEEFDVLLQTGRQSRDITSGEPTGQIAYRGSDGTWLWNGSSPGGPCLLLGDMVVAQNQSGGTARNILTGQTVYREHPITGTSVSWGFGRKYGCNTFVGCANLITFRSGAAGYFDLKSNMGTGNLGGFKSGCSASLIPANGVLNAPDYTRTCTCGYQNQTSLALIHMPETEMWTYTTVGSDSRPLKKVGINFGAPGDRLSDDGVLWLDYPSVGGSSPDLGVTTIPAEPACFRHHSAWFEGAALPWVTASGAIGLTHVTIPTNKTQETQYLVRLFFVEPKGATAGQRVFDVILQGKQMLANFDIAREEPSRGIGTAMEFQAIKATNQITLELKPVIGQPVISGIEVIGL